MADTETITIQGHTFEAPVRYHVGQNIELSAGEAQAMNQTLHENLRNNFAAKMKKVLEEHKIDPKSETKLPDDILSTLREDFEKFADEYEFGVRAPGAARVTDPIRREAENIAREKIREILRSQKQKAEAKDIAEAAKTLVDANPEYMELARKRVEEKQQIAAIDLNSIVASIPKAAPAAESHAAE